MRFGHATRALRFGALIGLLGLASCQSMNLGDAFKSKADAEGKPGDEQLSGADLRAYCPRVTLLEGTAILRTYAKGHQDDPDYIIYQATITDVTRTCQYQGGNMYMHVAAAGRIVWGPKGTAGSLDLPVRVAVKEGDTVAYSQLGHIQVSVPAGKDAIQFIYKDDQIVVPAPTDQNLIVLTGFDEGPAKAR